MGVGEKSLAIWKPGSGGNLPVHGAILQNFRLRNGLRLVTPNQLGVHPFPVTVGKILSIGRNCSAINRIFGGVYSELPKLKLRQSARGGWHALGRPEDHACAD